MRWDVNGARIDRVIEFVMPFTVDFFAEATPADVAPEAAFVPDFVDSGTEAACDKVPHVLLSTPRLVLRRFGEHDTAAFASYRSDPDVARYQSWTTPVPIAEAIALVREFGESDPQSAGWFQYAVQLRSKSTLIGDVGVNLHANLMQAEIGFTFAPAHQGQGYATETVRCVVDHLFTHRGLHKVSAECDARNLPSVRLLERVGFRQEGHLRAHTWLKEEWTDDLLFGLLSEDWVQLIESARERS